MSSQKPAWKKLTSKIVYQNPWLKVHEDNVVKPDGEEGIYGVIETRGPSVFIIPINEKGEIYLIHQYRYTVSKDSWEIPAGNTDGQDKLIAAKRELQEETGLTAQDWELAGRYHVMGGVSTEFAYVFIARNLTQSNKNEQQEEGINQMKAVSFEKVFEMIAQGLITDGQSISALMIAALKLNAQLPQLSKNLFQLAGKVAPNKGRGKELGYPTANLPVDPSISDGLYVGFTTFDTKRLPSLIFIGPAITFGETDKKAEIYILNFDGDLYDKELYVEVTKKLRDNIKFNSSEELVAQMQQDEVDAKAYFQALSKE